MEANNIFSLDLNETLFFESGYEIDEMMSISIDPEISIQSFNDYVSIRGVVELEGEYIKVIDTPEQQFETDIEKSNQVQRVVARVIEKEDNQIVFNHHFPIDISVPLHRVRSLEDVTVSVKTFDYKLAQPNHLKIYSTLKINGVHQEEGANRPKKEEQLETPNIQLDDKFQFKIIDSKQSKEEQQSSDKNATIDQKTLKGIEKNEKQDNIIDLGKEVKHEQRPVKKTDHTDAKDIIKQDIKVEETINDKKEEKTNSENINSIDLHTASEDDLPLEPSIESPEREQETLKVVEQVSQSADGINVETQSTTQNDHSSATAELQDITYLAEMFDSSEEIEPYQMRLCIVQKDDTIITIAERYDITPQQIIHVNNLEAEQLTDGQLLLIPTENKT